MEAEKKKNIAHALPRGMMSVLLWGVLLFLHACRAIGGVLLSLYERSLPSFRMLQPRRSERDWKQPEYSKLPRHVAVVINDAELLRQRSSVVSFVSALVKTAALYAVVEHVTLYDEKGKSALTDNRGGTRLILEKKTGVLKSKQDAIYDELRDVVKSPSAPPHSQPEEATKARSADSGYGTLESSSSGTSTPVLASLSQRLPASTSAAADEPQRKEKRVRLSILSEHDGREAIAQVANELLLAAGDDGGDAKDDDEDRLSHESISAALDSSWPSEGQRDPDLLIIVGGSQMRLKGFPPWQLRLTEFYHDPMDSSGSKARPDRIVFKGFALYSHCEMRFGR